MREKGIYADIDINEYHREEGISSSGISLILDCPKRYWHEYISDAKKKEKNDQKYKIGRAFHMLALEPEKFSQTFYTMDEEVNLTTKIGKEKYAEAESLASGREILRFKDWESIRAMSEAAGEHPIWEQIGDGLIEQSIYWHAGFHNTRMRSRPDIYTDRYVIDVKTTESIPGFRRSLYQYGYHRQAAMQIDALKAFDSVGRERFFGFFVIEKNPPYLTACFTLDEESIALGRKEYIDGANIYSECFLFNEWPGYEEKFQVISTPKWALNKEEIF